MDWLVLENHYSQGLMQTPVYYLVHKYLFFITWSSKYMTLSLLCYLFVDVVALCWLCVFCIVILSAILQENIYSWETGTCEVFQQTEFWESQQGIADNFWEWPNLQT